jgi:ketosteroid isomerase-like protein
MGKHSSLFLCTIALAVVQIGCDARPTGGDLQAINTLQSQVDSAIINGDTERYVGFLADDAVLMPPNAPPVVGKEAIRSWNAAMSKEMKIEAYTSSDDEVVVAGDWAFRRATVDWTIRSRAIGQPIRDSAKYLIVYARQPDGSWKVARDIWSSNTHAP